MTASSTTSDTPLPRPARFIPGGAFFVNLLSSAHHLLRSMIIHNQAQANALAAAVLAHRNARARAVRLETFRLAAGILAAGVVLRLVLLLIIH